jgi:hypothetical protein
MPFKSIEFDPEFAGPQSWAAMYRAQGLQIVPAFMPGEDPEWKRPVMKWREFETALVTLALFERWYGTGGQYSTRWNMGVITGKASGGLVVIDLDQHEGKDGMGWWLGLLAVHANSLEPETCAQRTGGGGRQLFFTCPPGWTAPTIKTPIGVDIRGEGGFAMVPPSRHESGRSYEWELGREPWSIPPQELPSWAAAAIDKLREEYARLAGQGGVTRIGLASDTNAFGKTVDGREARMAGIVWGVWCDLRRQFPGELDPVVEDAEHERAWNLYLFEVKSRFKEAPQAEGLEREGRGRSAFDERWRRAKEQWNGKLKEEAAAPKPGASPNPKPNGFDHFDPWARVTVPSFPLDCLPQGLQAFVEYQTVSLGADPAGVAMAALTALSGALDQRFALKMRRSGDWYSPPRLWTILVGEPATKKTPIVTAVTKPLRRIEADFAAQHRRDVMLWEAQDKADRGARPPDPTRFIMNDVTVEVAGEILARQQRGALVVHDELSSFIGSLDRYGAAGRGASDRAFWLTAYNGGSYSVDRMSRAIYIANLCVAFLGGMQPDRLRELADLMTDGLLQRFNPVLIERGAPSAEADNELIAMRYGDLIGFLVNLRPQTFLMTDGGLRAAEELRAEVYELESAPGVLGRGFCAWAGKLAATHGSLALLLHIIENKEDAAVLQVGESTVRHASKIITEFLLPHGRAFYQDTLNVGSDEGLQTVASYLLTSDQDRYTLSDLRYNARPLRDVKTAWQMNALLAPFVSGGWIIEDANGKAWAVASDLRQVFAERRAYELQRKAEIMSRFKPKGPEHDPPL